MIIEHGTVVSIQGKNALISIRKSNTCSQCASNLGCGMGLFSGIVRQKCSEILLDNVIDAGIGDQVEIGVSEKSLLRLTAITYLLPLLIMLSSGLLCKLVFAALDDKVVTIVSLSGFIMGIILAAYMNKKMNSDLSLHPKVLSITKQCAS